MVGAVLVLARLLQFASTLVLFGSGLYALYGARSETRHEPEPECIWLRSLLLLTTSIAVASGLGWLSAEAASLTGTWTSLIAVITGTRFGALLALRVLVLVLLLVTCLFLRPVRLLAAVASFLGGLVVASFAWTGHGSMGSGIDAYLHPGADVLHLLASGTWLGALASLSILIVRLHRAHTAVEARLLILGLARFSAIGPAVVAILTLTGLVNTWYLIGPSHWSALFHTPYGSLLLAKLALFLGMLLMAARNRFRLAPRLRWVSNSSKPLDPVWSELRITLLVQSGLSLLVLAVVGVLGMLQPPISMD